MTAPDLPSAETVAETAGPGLEFAARDGAVLPYQYQPTAAGQRRGALLLLAHPHDPPGALPTPDALALGADGFDNINWTLPPDRPERFEDLLHTLRDFMDHLGMAHGLAASDIHLLAAGTGAMLAAAWVHDFAPLLRGLTLVAPAFLPRPPMSLAGADARKVRFVLLPGQREAADRVVRDAAAITVPVQLLLSSAAKDTAEARAEYGAFLAGLGEGLVKSRQELPGLFGDAPDERVRMLALEAVRGFVQRLADHPAPPPDLREADQRGPSADAARALAAPLPPKSLRAWGWTLRRLVLRGKAVLSPGLYLGLTTGLDSGPTVDYVYRNTPLVVPVLGDRVDRAWLEAPLARAQRQRKQHVAELLQQAMAWVMAKPRPALVLDIAAGRGRCLFDALDAGTVQPGYVLLRDHAAGNIRVAKAEAAARSVGRVNQVRCEQADGLDPATLADFAIRATVVIAAGLYERCPDNMMVRKALVALATAVEPGGYLVYSNEPWHPQAEYQARALDRPLRHRSQAEMDQLVAEAGFRKLTQCVGPEGICTVSLAQRVADLPAR